MRTRWKRSIRHFFNVASYVTRVIIRLTVTQYKFEFAYCDTHPIPYTARVIYIGACNPWERGSEETRGEESSGLEYFPKFGIVANFWSTFGTDLLEWFML